MGWASIAIIAYFTLTGVGLVDSIYHKISPFVMHLKMRRFADFEHVLAFAVFGLIFCFAYPKRTFMVCCVVFGSAIALEFMQTLTPDRHGTLRDATEKIAGGASGILLAKYALEPWFRRRCTPRS